MRIKKLVSRLVRKYQTRDPFEMIKGMNVILVHWKASVGFTSTYSGII